MTESAAHQSTVRGLPRDKAGLQSYFRPGKQAHNPMCPLYRKYVVLGTRQPRSPQGLKSSWWGQKCEKNTCTVLPCSLSICSQLRAMLLLTQRHASTFELWQFPSQFSCASKGLSLVSGYSGTSVPPLSPGQPSLQKSVSTTTKDHTLMCTV